MKTREMVGWRLAVAGIALAFAAAVPLGVQAEEQNVQAEVPDVWLEYVEARGDQAVDVGVVGKVGTKAEVSFRWTAERFSEISLLGARMAADGGSRAGFVGSYDYAVPSSNKKIRNAAFLGCGTSAVGLLPDLSNAWTVVRWERDRDYIVKAELSVTNETQTAGRLSFIPQNRKEEDVRHMPTVVTNGVSDTGLNLYLFAANVDGVADNKAWARVYAVRIWQDDAQGVSQLVRDLRPCLKNGRAGLYDAVSSNIFYSITGVDLVYDTTYNEPDYYVDYVDSDGTSYVDVGVRARSGTSCRADMAWNEVGKTNMWRDIAFLDARTATNKEERVYLLHCSQNGIMGLGYGGYIYSNPKFFFTAGTRYVVETTLKAGEQKSIVDGQTLAYSATVTSTYDTGLNFYLFANNIAGTPENRSRARVYSLKIWQDVNGDGVIDNENELVRDFKPCVKYGRGALYDAVDQRIFFPAEGRLLPALLPVVESGKPDRYLTYLDSPGDTYLDTGVRAKTGTKIVTKMRWNSFCEGGDYIRSFDWLNEMSFLAAGIDPQRVHFVLSPNKNIWSGYGTNGVYAPKNKDLPADDKHKDNRRPLTAGVDYTYEGVYTATEQTLRLDGETVVSTSGLANVDAGCNLYLFACNGDGSIRYPSRTRVYMLKIWQDVNGDGVIGDNELVRDFKPCQKGRRAGLYDAVSDQIFYPNKPLPDVCMGPAVDAATQPPAHLVEYVETDGTQWLDMEVTGQSGVSTEFEMAWLDVGGDVGLLGSRKDDSETRFYPWHNANKSQSFGYQGFHYIHATDSAQVVGRDHPMCVPVVPNKTYHVRTNFETNRVQIVVNGVTKVDRTGDFALNTGRDMYLFAENVKGSVENKSRVRLYNLKIWQDGKPVRNFVPVRLGDEHGTVALWDKVSEKPFFLENGATYTVVGPVVGKFPRGLMLIFK